LGRGLHGHYGYGKYRYYRYPYGLYHYKSYNGNSYYGDAYSDNYLRDGGSTGRLDYEKDYAHGWYLLKKDRAEEALKVFSRLAQASPSRGAAKVGYSIASAELGKLDKGIWAMRRALRTDPDALHYVTIDDELRPKVEQAAERYEWSSQDSENDPGGTLMLAALYYLLDDVDAAREAMERNIMAYDTSTSAENLKRLIEEATQVN
jgi:hypothetical protein